MSKVYRLAFIIISFTCMQQAIAQSCLVITSHPRSQTICQGTNNTFTITYTGTALSFQWRKNSLNIPGATAISYTINGAVLTDLGYYDCLITTACGVFTTGAAILVVRPATVMVTHPQSQSICAGSTATFRGDAIGLRTLFQWRKNGVNIPGANTSVYTINNLSLADAGNYDVVISGLCGTVTSNVAILEVSTKGSWLGLSNSDWNNTGNWCTGSIPDNETDVLIHASAPHMPVVNAFNAQARKITIDNGASLTVIMGSSLDIYGDLINNGALVSATGDLGFKGSSLQSIPSFVCNNAEMNGTGGILLTGDATVTGTLNLIKGNISLANSNLTLPNGTTGSPISHIVTNGDGAVKVLNLAAFETRLVPVGPDEFDYNPVLLTANSDHVTDNLFVRVIKGVYIHPFSGPQYRDHVVNCMWLVNEEITGGSNVNISLQWNSWHELEGFQRTRCYIMQYNGAYWPIPSNFTAVAPGPYTLTKNNISSFSPLAIRSTPIPQAASGSSGFYPNPARDQLNVVLNLAATGLTDFSIYNLSGQLVSRTLVTVTPGLTQTLLNISKLIGGAYMLRVTVGQIEWFRERFIKVN